MKGYEQFLAEKQLVDAPSGFSPDDLSGYGLFDFQKVIVSWACQRGRAAVFADTGLGKTRIQVLWADQVVRETGGSVLVFAPLCVSSQTVGEAAAMGVSVQQVRSPDEMNDSGVYVTNYELFHKFRECLQDGVFEGVVLDESSILKHETSKTRTAILSATRTVPYRLSCTATPSPNDYMELGNQAEFLGVMDLDEMLGMFFTHDSGETSKWRLKGHAKSRFWEWMSHWAVCIRNPSDLGFDGSAFVLPGLDIQEHVVVTSESFGAAVARSLSERQRARKETIDARVAAVAERVNEGSEQWVVWCHLNEESEKLARAIPDAVEVKGSDSQEKKEKNILSFTKGESRVIVTKPSIAGFGMNWQHCNKMAFVGLSDSYEQLYQAIRRCYRYGQKKEVEVHLFSADREGRVLRNIKRKKEQHEEMSKRMVEYMKDFTTKEITGLSREKSAYERDVTREKDWTLYLGDCVEVTRELSDDSVGYTIFSPPFSSLYTYSNSDRDMGNSKDDEEFWGHFRFLIKELYRVLKPGRCLSVHCMNLPTTKSRDGFIGMRDFRGDIIKEFQTEGFIYHSEVCIWKDPVVAMQRTKALGLLWKQIKKDSAMCRQGIPDHIVTFRKPGENQNPISHSAEEFPVDEWQQLASPVWFDIKQSNTLNSQGAREDDDERHICPLQLDVIQRCVRLWSAEGDVVFSPFAGIGSEGFVARKMGRSFVGIELKRSYYELALKNLRSAARDPSWDYTGGRLSAGVPKHVSTGRNQQSLSIFKDDERGGL